ncbi:MAG: 5-formyltetrahydrofolate cyclo-ligase [Rhodobacterales bacterium]|nr:MAG: 5-formyltetrahydrofolate cyclo-ligase [Rhodobacterales bacterium]
MTLSDIKTAARKAALARRAAAHGRGLDAAAQDHLLGLLEPFRGRVIAGFMPIHTEINPLPVMAAMAGSGPVGVPVIEAKAAPLAFHRWRPGCAMEPGPYGAPVPVSREVLVPEVVIVPLLGFDRAGGRLGYGGGFYDRTLEHLRTKGPCLAVGFAYAAQEAEDLPLEETDQPLDAVVSEAGVLRF